VKLDVVDAVPPGVIMEITPVVPVPTTAVIDVGELTVYEDTAVPPIETAVAPVKFVPVIETVVPGQPLVGVKVLLIVGGGIV